MKIKDDKVLRYVKIKDEYHAELKKMAVSYRKTLQDFVNIIVENFLENNKVQVT